MGIAAGRTLPRICGRTAARRHRPAGQAAPPTPEGCGQEPSSSGRSSDDEPATTSNGREKQQAARAPAVNAPPAVAAAGQAQSPLWEVPWDAFEVARTAGLIWLVDQTVPTALVSAAARLEGLSIDGLPATQKVSLPPRQPSKPQQPAAAWPAWLADACRAAGALPSLKAGLARQRRPRPLLRPRSFRPSPTACRRRRAGAAAAGGAGPAACRHRGHPPRRRRAARAAAAQLVLPQGGRLWPDARARRRHIRGRGRDPAAVRAVAAARRRRARVGPGRERRVGGRRHRRGRRRRRRPRAAERGALLPWLPPAGADKMGAAGRGGASFCLAACCGFGQHKTAMPAMCPKLRS